MPAGQFCMFRCGDFASARTCRLADLPDIQDSTFCPARRAPRPHEDRFKVFATASDWFAEKRGYHRRNGLIVKQRDDLLDATRCAVMMRRFARTEPRAPSFAMPAAPSGWLGGAAF